MKILKNANDELVSPLNDLAFAHIFGSKQNIGNTRAFLKTLLDIPEEDYDKLSVETSALRRYFQKDKLGVVDLRLITKSGRIIHIEVQVKKNSNVKNRMLYYGARMVGEQLRAGEDYNELHQVVSIWICDHELFEEEESYINRFELRNENGMTFTDMLKLVILELPKLPQDEDGALWPWLKFFKCKRKEDFDMLVKKHPEVKEAVDCVKYFSLGEQFRIEMLRRHIARLDRAQERSDARAEGRAEGREEEALAIARKMKVRGQPLAEIAEITGLSIETVEQL